MKPVEIWKDVPGYEGLYEVSNLGRVKRLGTYIKNVKSRTGLAFWKGGFIKGKLNKYGYHQIILSRNNIKHHINVHRLVAECFLEILGENFEVNHKNGNKNDNKAENLEWVSRSENVQHRFDVLGHKQNKGFESTCSKSVEQFTLDGNYVAIYGSIREAVRETGYNRSGISGCCHNKPHHKTAGGFIWRYADTDKKEAA